MIHTFCVAFISKTPCQRLHLTLFVGVLSPVVLVTPIFSEGLTVNLIQSITATYYSQCIIMKDKVI